MPKEVLVGAADWGKADMGVHGEIGIGVGDVCSSAGELGVAPGSRNEKKLCDIECLW